MFINTEHEQSCQHQVNFTINDSCQFYNHCIDQYFPCEEFGFTLRYAKRRCQAILEVQKGESITFSSTHIRDWTMQHETCLRGKLLHLLQTFTNSSKPDKPVCLLMETRAFKAIEECYNETLERFCPSESNGLAIELNDSLLLAELFSLNDSYYEHTVKQGLSKLFRACNHTSADAASRDLESRAPQRVVICARHSANDIRNSNPWPPFSTDEYVKNVSMYESIPQDQLVYGGHVLHAEGGECIESAEPWVRDGRVHLLLWSVPPQVKVNHSMLYRYQRLTTHISLELWSPVKFHRKGECGDGIRQAMEMCDGGVFSGRDYACTADCHSWDGFECSSLPLTKSDCLEQKCGNGERTSDEECDDGNEQNDDGCSSVCRVEPGWNCTSDYQLQSTCTPPMPSPSPTPSLPTIPITTPPPLVINPNSAEMTSKHLVIVVASVLVALLVSSGLGSVLPSTGTTGHDQRRKPEEALDAPVRPCWNGTRDSVTWCMPHEPAADSQQ